MSTASTPKKLSFLHIVPFTRDDPAAGLEDALDLFSYAEELGLDGGWIRTRHIQYGVPSAAVFLAAAAQRTSRIDLGTAVIPTVYESPLRLAEDLALADILSGGRLQPGLSVGAAKHDATVSERILGARWQEEDTSYARVERIRSFIAGTPVTDAGERAIGLGGVGEFSSDRVEPHSPGLAERLWYGAGSLRSARWAGEAGFKLLVSNISTAENSEVFTTAQREQIDLFRSVHAAGDEAVVSVGRVVIPTDGATSEQRERFESYVDARTARTLQPQGERRTIIAPDVLGSTEQIAAALRADAAVQGADELLFELPFQFGREDYRHILRVVAEEVGPALGWTPQR